MSHLGTLALPKAGDTEAERQKLPSSHQASGRFAPATSKVLGGDNARAFYF